MIRKFLYAFGTIVLIAAGFFTVPVSVSSRGEEFPREAPVVFVPDARNRGERCRDETIYTTEKLRGAHEGQGYDFTVDENCFELQKQMIKAVSDENPVEIKSLIARGASVGEKDFSTNEAVYPLQIAATGNYRIVKLLLDNGADPNAEYCCCAMCDSPLVKAVEKGNAETVRLLLERGAKADFKTHWADSPYTIFDARPEKNGDGIRSLLAADCDQTLRCRVRYRYKMLNDLIDRLFGKRLFNPRRDAE